jgi:hypothetical protein
MVCENSQINIDQDSQEKPDLTAWLFLYDIDIKSIQYFIRSDNVPATISTSPRIAFFVLSLSC